MLLQRFLQPVLAFVLSMVLSMLALALPAQAEMETRFLSPGQVPEYGMQATDFAPQGWTVEDSWEHELNNDTLMDMVLMLGEDLPSQVDGIPNERWRALVVLLAEEQGGYRVAGLGLRILHCSTCYGMLGGPEGGLPLITFHDNVLIVNQLSGSRVMFDLTLRFRFDPGSNRMVLIGRDARITDRLSASNIEESTNMITGRHIVTRSHIDPATEMDVTVKEEGRVAPSNTPMDEVDAVDMSRTPTFEQLDQLNSLSE